MATYKEIESPLSAFNNFILEISNELSTIFYPKEKENILLKNNKIFFEDKVINLFGFIKIENENENFFFRFNGKINETKMELIHICYKNKCSIFQIYQKYLHLYSMINSNYDNEISHKYVEMVYNKILKKHTTEIFLIPYKNKIYRTFDTEKTYLFNLMNKFQYGIEFTKENSFVNYNIIRLLSSDLNESKSIENIRFFEKEYIHTDKIKSENLKETLINIFYYGKI